MTKNEARAIFQKHADWASGKSGDTSFFGSVKEAREVLCEPPSIAQSIRDAAINWPRYLSGVECQIIDAFQGVEGHWWQALLRSKEKAYRTQARTFMLLVAEALE